MDIKQMLVNSALLVLLDVVIVVNGHGRLMEPPSRSSLWRLGYEVPKNYDDNGLNCGGRDRQWITNNGQCGLCGDPFDGERQNEAGGRYANGVIGRTYTTGQPINVEVDITSAHGGWFEFRLCANNDPTKAITQECLNRYLLQDSAGATRFQGVPTGGTGGAEYLTLQYALPVNLTCTQCVLQWKYHTAKDWGCDVSNGARTCGLGYGPQEEFYGCADIAIRESSVQPDTTTTTTTTVKSTASPSKPTTTTETTASATTAPSKVTKTTKKPVTATQAVTSDSNTTQTTTTTHNPKTTPASPSPSQAEKSTNPASVKDILSCQGRGSLQGTVMDQRCRSLCRTGDCLLAFCNDACHSLA